MLSAISEGYKQGDRDDHRRERDHPDHGVHPLRARDRRGQGLRLHARDRHDRLAVHRGALHPGGARRCSAARRSCARRRFLGASGEGRQWKFDFTGASKWFFSISGRDPRDRRDRVRDQAAQPRDRLRVGDQDPGRAGRAARASTRSATRCVDGGIDGADTAKIQEVENPEFGENVFQIQAKISPDAGDRGRSRVLDDAFGLETGRGRASTRPRSGRPSASRSRARR